MPARVARLEDLDRIDAGGVHWRPVRRTLGISAFGTNAYSADADEHVVEPHDADSTFVMAFGGRPGAFGPVSAWEWIFGAAPHAQAGDWEAAYATAAHALEDHPDDGNTHFNLACFAAQAGRTDDALDHLRRAVAGDERTAEWALDDADLDPIRDDPRFAEALRR